MVRQYFGTDGIRGLANTPPMTAETALKVGMAAGKVLAEGGGHRLRAVIGKDTRLSGYMIENALMSGFTAVGVDVFQLGPMPTPAVAMLTRSLRADIGVMISASHNQFADNGIKLFDSNGFKLSDEAEIAVLYLIDDAGRPCRVGFALGNEFSDHVLERQNYLYLAHSKLRPCSYGPELVLGELPADVHGTVSVLRGEELLWQAEWLSGEANMSHAVANLEHHHFKYPLFRRPGDIHVHFLGAAVLSYSAGIRAAPGDVFEIRSASFGAPLRNPLAIAEDEGMVQVRCL